MQGGHQTKEPDKAKKLESQPNPTDYSQHKLCIYFHFLLNLYRPYKITIILVAIKAVVKALEKEHKYKRHLYKFMPFFSKHCS